MVASEPGYRLKLQRARQRLDEIRARIGEYLDTQPYEAVTNFNTATRQYEVRAHICRHIPDGLPILIGEFLYNLRSALDQLAWQLVLRCGGSPNAYTEFPIFLDRNKFVERTRAGKPAPRSGLGKMQGMEAQATRIIEAIQPFNYTNGPTNEHPLWLLQTLCNEDKHHALVLVGAMTKPLKMTFTVPPQSAIGMCPTVGPFEDGGILTSFWMVDESTSRPRDATDSERELIEHPSVELFSDVAFSQHGPGRGLCVQPALDGMEMAVGWLIDTLG